MNYNIKINEVNRENSSVKAYATVVFGGSVTIHSHYPARYFQAHFA